MSNLCGAWFAVKHLEIHDGPGVRTTLFLKGCSLSCLWCHNPESICRGAVLAFYEHKCEKCGACVKVCPKGAHSFVDGVHEFDREKCISCGECEKVCSPKALMLFGKKAEAKDLLPELLLDKQFYEATGGGVTVSGGEPLLQADFVCELAELLRQNGVGLAIDTSLAVSEQMLLKAVGKADIFLCDIKAMDSKLHEKLTGRPNEQIISNFKLLDKLNVPVEIRVPIVPGQNDGEVEKITEFIATLHNVKAVKALAYHDLARTKYAALGMKYNLPDTVAPTSERLAEIQHLLEQSIK